MRPHSLFQTIWIKQKKMFLWTIWTVFHVEDDSDVKRCTSVEDGSDVQQLMGEDGSGYEHLDDLADLIFRSGTDCGGGWVRRTK